MSKLVSASSKEEVYDEASLPKICFFNNLEEYLRR